MRLTSLRHLVLLAPLGLVPRQCSNCLGSVLLASLDPCSAATYSNVPENLGASSHSLVVDTVLLVGYASRLVRYSEVLSPLHCGRDWNVFVLVTG